jgi:thymidine kinase
MKGFKIFGLFLLLAAFTLPAMASTGVEPTEGKIIFKTKSEGLSLEYRLSNLQQMETSVAIFSLDGDTRYYRGLITDHNGYANRLDLSKLADGKYKIMVTNAEETHVKVLKIEDETILLSK